MKALLLVVMLMGAALAQDQPIKFRGAFIGQPLSDYVDCSSGKGRALEHGYRTHGQLCEGKRGLILHTQTKGLMDPRTSGESFVVEDRKVIRIVLFVPNEDWDKVRYDLTQKLGSPSSELPEVYQNGFGARWEFSQGFWSKGDLVVVAGVKVLTLLGSCVERALGPGCATDGIRITITDAAHAKLPSTLPSTLE